MSWCVDELSAQMHDFRVRGLVLSVNSFPLVGWEGVSCCIISLLLSSSSPGLGTPSRLPRGGLEKSTFLSLSGAKKCEGGYKEFWEEGCAEGSAEALFLLPAVFLGCSFAPYPPNPTPAAPNVNITLFRQHPFEQVFASKTCARCRGGLYRSKPPTSCTGGRGWLYRAAVV